MLGVVEVSGFPRETVPRLTGALKKQKTHCGEYLLPMGNERFFGLLHDPNPVFLPEALLLWDHVIAFDFSLTLLV